MKTEIIEINTVLLVLVGIFLAIKNNYVQNSGYIKIILNLMLVLMTFLV